MWVSFFLSALLCAVFLYLPGFLALKGLRLSSLPALIGAPLISMALYCVLPIIYDVIGVPSSWISVLFPTLLLCLAPLAYSAARKRLRSQALFSFSQETITIARKTLDFNWSAAILYISIASLACLLIFIKGLDGAVSFDCKQDNVTHLNVIKAFLDSGSWSTLHTSYYLATTNPDAIPYDMGRGAFYPAGLYVLTAIVCSAASVPVTLGLNAVIAVLIALVYPLGMFGVMRSIFPEQKSPVLGGAIIAIAFTSFPWGILLKGPLYPNMASFTFMVPTIALIMEIVRQGKIKAMVLPFSLFACCAFITLAIVQTSALFALFLFGAFFLINQGCRAISTRFDEDHTKRFFFVFGTALFGLAALLVIWFVLYKLPFVQGVVQFNWKSDLSFTEGVINTVSLGLTASGPQWILTALTTLGIYDCIKQKRVWLLGPVLFMAAAYIESRTSEGFIKHYLGGFWYTDPYRLAGLLAIFAVPLASAGLSTIAETANKISKSPACPSNFPALCAILLIALFIFIPSYIPPFFDYSKDRAPFGTIENRIEKHFSEVEKRVFDHEEQLFIEQAKTKIPNGALVLNMPDDGSAFAYATNDLNTYYRYRTLDGESENSRIIRERLPFIASDPSVQKAVERTGARHLLLLDQGIPHEEGKWLPSFKRPEDWAALNSINDETPGFRLILAEGDMRLYEIVALDAEN